MERLIFALVIRFFITLKIAISAVCNAISQQMILVKCAYRIIF